MIQLVRSDDVFFCNKPFNAYNQVSPHSYHVATESIKNSVASNQLLLSQSRPAGRCSSVENATQQGPHTPDVRATANQIGTQSDLTTFANFVVFLNCR